MRNPLLLLLALVLFLSGCDQARLYEENTDLAGYEWPEKLQPVYSFQVTDTTQAYDLFINLRYAASYPYQNLYVKHSLYSPDSMLMHSALNNLLLSDPKTGEPKGKGVGDIWDHRVRFIRNVKFTRGGTYSIKLQQYMRTDPVPGIVSVGLRVAKAEVNQ